MRAVLVLPLQEDPEMGKASREKPRFLARKLLKIRQTIDGGLSQDELVRKLGLSEDIDRHYISKYERGVIEPPLRILLAYANLAGIYLEVLADDDLELPGNLPCIPKSQGVKRKKAKR
jgi:transcriptional regulator with XRE-family HTH domain